MRTALPLAFSIAACCAAPARAADIDAASHIDAVTLYPDAASVTRIAEIDLPEGASRLIFRGLPASVDPASLRLRGEGASRLVLGAVDLRKAPAATEESDFDRQLKALRDQRAGAQVQIDALAAKRDMMKLYGQSSPIGAGDRGLKPEEWSAAWDAVGAGLAKTGEDLRQARAAAEALDLRIKALEAARPAPAPKGPTRDVAVDVTAASAGAFRLALSYRVAGAHWTPVYEARLATGGKDGKPSLELDRRALVAQTTGEDWRDARLTLAAFRATGAAAAPEVVPQVIAFYEPPVPVAGMAKSEGALRNAPAAAPAPMRVAAETARAQLDAGAFQASFVAPGLVSLPSDGSAKNIALSVQNPAAELSWRMAPALDPRAFLSVHYVNGEQAPLLPGAVTLYRDGELIGKAQLALIAPQEGADLGFGVDDKVLVQRQPVRRKENEPGWFGQNKVETREFKTTIRNLHDFPIRAVVTDQTPYSENAAISVELLAQTTPPTEKDPDGKRGLLRWRFDLAPDTSKDLVLAYRMKWPADREVVIPPP